MTKKFTITLFLLTLILLNACVENNEFNAPAGLMCELLRDPSQAVITDPKPEFGWIVNDNRRGAVQTARQIIVASSEELIGKNKGDMWDSGKDKSDKSVNVEYMGKPLTVSKEYWWKVRTWDNNDKASPYSEEQKFITGRQILLPDKSNWVKTADGEYLLENRQKAEYHGIEPHKLIQVGKRHLFADFGKAAFATFRIHIDNPRDNDSLIIFLGERKTDDNLVHKHPGKSNIGFKKIILKTQKEKHTYSLNLPRHISHAPNRQELAEHMPEVLPFRYVELINAPEGLQKNDIKQLALFYYFDNSTSAFTSSNGNLNKVWDLCKYTLKATPFLALYADGNRERMPYEADAYIQQLGHYSVDREYALARYTLQFLLNNPSWPTEWHMHTVLMAYADYMQTGNTELIEKYYDELKAKTLLALEREDGLISTRTGLLSDEVLASLHFTGKSMNDIVDWPAGTKKGEKQASNQGPTPEGERDGYVFTDYNTVVNAFHYRTLVLMAKMAQAINKEQEAKDFATKAERVKESMNLFMFDRNREIYIDGIGTSHSSLHANMFPLAFGIAPAENIKPIVSFIKSRDMACSVYGAQYLLEGLYKTGESSYALKLMTSNTKRSWLNMINVGSTMTTEAWDEYYKPNLTWNHAWGSAPANIIPRELMGIEPLQPAFRMIRIKPQPADLKNIRLKISTIRGTVICEWNIKGNLFFLNVTIPANSEGQIWIPAVSAESIREKNIKIKEVPDIRALGEKEGYFIYNTPAGHFSFTGELR